MSAVTQAALPAFRPVIMGSDLGVYSLARAFHEAYAVSSIVVSNSPRGPIMDSAILEPRFAGAGASSSAVVALLEKIAAEHAETLILLPTAEHELDLVSEHWDRLGELYVIPYSPPSVMHRARDKRVLEEICQELSLPVPRSVHIELDGLTQDALKDLEIDLVYPLVLKPANSGEHTQLSFPGKRKVYMADDADGVRRTFGALIEAGYGGAMVVQELVPGDDTAGRTATCYVNQQGQVTLMATGQLLLGMHSPTMIGNSVAVLTDPQPDVADQAETIATELGVRGFVNFDLKVDARDGRGRFFDLNTRIGRPNHYLLVAGVNPAVAIVEDFLLDGPPQIQKQTRVGVYSYVPKFWLLRYITDPKLATAVRRAWKATKPGPHPLVYSADRSPRRLLYRITSTVNLLRNYWTFYRRPNSTGI